MALLVYGLQLKDASEALVSMPLIEQAITIEESYESRVTGVLASFFAHAHFPDKLEAMQDFRKYFDAGSWAVMACGPALALMLLADREPITMAKFEASPFFLPPPEQDIYAMNAFLLAITILASNGADDVKGFVMQVFGGSTLPEKLVAHPDVALVFQACQGLLAALSDNPRESFLSALRDKFGSVLGTTTGDFDASRAQMGAALGIVLALYFARLQAGSNRREIQSDQQIAISDGLAGDVCDLVTQFLAPLLSSPARDAAIVALVAGACDPQIFRKFLLVYAAYQLSMGDYPYYKVLLMILAVFLVVHARTFA